MYIIIVLSRINENPGHLYNILFIGIFELFSEAVRSHYGVQCTCSAEKLVLAVRCLNVPCLMVFIIIYVVTYNCGCSKVYQNIASFTKMTVYSGFQSFSLHLPSLDPRPHFPLGKWAWYRLLAHALISPRYLGALDNIVYAQ